MKLIWTSREKSEDSLQKIIIPMHKNMPQLAGHMKWAIEVKQRLSGPTLQFKQLKHP